MANKKGKTVRLLLEDGTLSGLLTIEDSSWNPGEMYVAPRASVDDLVATGACNKFGVYLLLSDSRVYVGESSDLAKRLKQHRAGKDWWEKVILFTTSNDSLNRSDIDYLEYCLIEKAQKNGNLDSDNKSKGNKSNVDKFRKPELDQYLEEALFLVELIGIHIFSSNDSKGIRNISKLKKKNSKNNNQTDSLSIEKKSQAIDYLVNNGIQIGKNVN